MSLCRVPPFTGGLPAHAVRILGVTTTDRQKIRRFPVGWVFVFSCHWRPHVRLVVDFSELGTSRSSARHVRVGACPNRINLGSIRSQKRETAS